MNHRGRMPAEETNTEIVTELTTSQRQFHSVWLAQQQHCLIFQRFLDTKHNFEHFYTSLYSYFQFYTLSTVHFTVCPHGFTVNA